MTRRHVNLPTDRLYNTTQQGYYRTTNIHSISQYFEVLIRDKTERKLKLSYVIVVFSGVIYIVISEDNI